MADLSWILGMKIAFAVFIRRVRERRVSYGFSSRETSLNHAGNITGTRGINAREMEHRSSLVPGNETVSRTIGELPDESEFAVPASSLRATIHRSSEITFTPHKEGFR